MIMKDNPLKLFDRLENEIIYLRDDVGAKRMRNIALNHGNVHVYVVHPLCQPDFAGLDPLLEYLEVTSTKENDNGNRPTEGNGVFVESGDGGPTDQIRYEWPNVVLNEER